MGEAAGNPVKTRAVAPVEKGRSVGENHKESVWEAVPERAQGLPRDASGNPERIGITLRGSLLLRVLHLDERPPETERELVWVDSTTLPGWTFSDAESEDERDSGEELPTRLWVPENGRDTVWPKRVSMGGMRWPMEIVKAVPFPGA